MEVAKDMTEVRKFFKTLGATYSQWSDDHGSMLASSLAYYTMFSMAPLLVISIALAALIFGDEASSGQLFSAVRDLVGDEGAATIQSMVQSANQHKEGGILATCLGVITLMIGATSVFISLQESLNLIWGVVQKRDAGLLGMLRQRLLSFGMVGGIAFLLLVSLVASAALSALGKFMSSGLPGGLALWHIVNFVVSFGVTTCLFAMIFKILPDVKLKWRWVWKGAIFTSFLFEIGKFAIGLYLGKGSVASSYGAAGSIAVVLIWIYYSSIILFLGAEFTKVNLKDRKVTIEAAAGASFLRT